LIEWIKNKENVNYLIVIATILGPVIATIITIIYYKFRNDFETKQLIEDRLFKIQQLAFKYPYVEDYLFIKTWNDFVEKYRKEQLNDEENNNLDKYLRYEQYCEMIFNLISFVFDFYKNENKVLQIIDFKSWARAHKDWWNNPIDKYSNKDTYDKKMVDIINKWIG